MAQSQAFTSREVRVTPGPERARLHRLLALGWVAVSLAACGNPCFTDNRPRCEDAHTLGICAGSVDAAGQSQKLEAQPCPSQAPVCVAVRVGGALCAESRDPDPACAGGSFCSGSTAVDCNQGFVTGRRACAGGCQASGGRVTCAP